MRSKGAPVRHRCPCLMLSPALCVDTWAGGDAWSRLRAATLLSVPGSTLNHITANLGLRQWRQEPQHLPFAACRMPGIWATVALQGRSPPWKMREVVWTLGSCRWFYCLAPAKLLYGRLGLWHLFLKAGVCFGYQFFPPFPLGQILLDTSDWQSHNRYKPKLPSWVFEF